MHTQATLHQTHSISDAGVDDRFDDGLRTPLIRATPDDGGDSNYLLIEYVVPWRCWAYPLPADARLMAVVARHWHVLTVLGVPGCPAPLPPSGWQCEPIMAACEPWSEDGGEGDGGEGGYSSGSDGDGDSDPDEGWADEAGERCGVCDSADCVHPTSMLLCDGDGCDAGYHMSPQLTVVPEGDWFCPVCSRSRKRQRRGTPRSVGGATLAGQQIEGRALDMR
jgi:hypothetical protein